MFHTENRKGNTETFKIYVAQSLCPTAPLESEGRPRRPAFLHSVVVHYLLNFPEKNHS